MASVVRRIRRDATTARLKARLLAVPFNGMRMRARWHRRVALPALEAKLERFGFFALTDDEKRHLFRVRGWLRQLSLQGVSE